MSDILCFATAKNSKGRHDGDYFMSEMIRFIRHKEYLGYNTCEEISLNTKNRLVARGATLSGIRDNDGFTTAAFFMHGSWKWLFGSGFHIWNVTELARALYDHRTRTEDLTVILYACSCGRGKYPSTKQRPIVERDKILGRHGFAHRLSAELGLMGVRAKVFAHTTKGDTTRNPMLCMITTNPDTLLTTTIYYREYIKRTRGKAGWAAFIKLMRHDSEFRFDVPYMHMDSVLARIDLEMACGE